MSRRIRQGWVFVAVVALLAMVTACKDKPEPVTQVEAKPKGPDYQVFAPLEKLSRESTLPFVIGADELFPCFQAVEALEPTEPDILVKEMLEKQTKDIAKLVRDWFVEDLSVEGISPTIAGKWTITPVNLKVIEVPRDQIRLTENPECLEKSGWIPEGQHLAVAYFGATQFDFESSLPLNMDIQEAMLSSLGMENIMLESEALFVYEAAMDDNGEPMLNPEGKELYTSPTGEYITVDAVPPPEKRLMEKWTIKSEKPLYFGFKEIANDAWRKEKKKEQCNLILIPDQLDPIKPECPEFQEVGFSVTIVEDEKPVSLTMTLGEEDHKGVQLGWGEGKKIQLNDRIIVWLKPEKVEVGVNLFVNSLVLDPLPMPDQPAEAVEEIADEAKVEAEAEKKAEKEEAEAKQEKKKKKKGKETDQDKLDEFLGMD